ncbi:MAG: hypothetical protein HY897_14260 [Deltaproteobacteria bacterium]|nr:hypothetical protein [Deltaproteobacteria bacterium]
MTTIFLLLSLLTAGPGAEGGAEVELAALLPAQVDGWKAAEPDEHATYDTLFRLIDGGAEVYRSLNVSRVISRRYVKPGAADIVADIYDMGSAEDAYGAFHFDVRDGGSAGIGRESEWEKTNLFFWKDRFFVSVAAMAPGPAAEKAVLAVGTAVAAAIPRDGVLPELVRSLPEDGLLRSQIHYFHDWPLLKRHYAFADENLLKLDKTTRGVLARYKNPAANGKPAGVELITLIQIRYATPDAARQALAAYRAKVMPGAGERGLRGSENGRWFAARAHADRVVIVFDAPTEKEALRRISQILPALPRKERP